MSRRPASVARRAFFYERQAPVILSSVSAIQPPQSVAGTGVSGIPSRASP